jgi:hypothetical protein
MCQIEFYYKIGQHCSGESCINFNYLVKQAKKARKADIKQKEYAQAEYIGVTPSNNKLDFAIIHCSKHYYDYIRNLDCFNNEENRKIFLDALLACMETGKTVISKYV